MVLASSVLVYHHYAHTNHSEEVTENDDSDEVKENEQEDDDNRMTKRRKSLSVVRSTMSTLSLPATNTAGGQEDVSPSWAEHNFHTPQPYKTPHPVNEQKKISFTNIPIIRM